MERGLVKDIADVFNLRKEDLKRLPGFSDVSAEQLVLAIERAKKIRLDRFIHALGIPGVGEATARLLAEKFKTLSALMNASKFELMRIRGIGPETADAIVKFFSDERNRNSIKKMLEYGVEVYWGEERKVPFRVKFSYSLVSLIVVREVRQRRWWRSLGDKPPIPYQRGCIIWLLGKSRFKASKSPKARDKDHQRGGVFENVRGGKKVYLTLTILAPL